MQSLMYKNIFEGTENLIKEKKCLIWRESNWSIANTLKIRGRKIDFLYEITQNNSFYTLKNKTKQHEDFKLKKKFVCLKNPIETRSKISNIGSDW